MGDSLTSLYRWVRWIPGEVLVARCLVRAWPPEAPRGAHRAPDRACRCGIAALPVPDHAWCWPAGALGGVVALSGHVIVRELPDAPGTAVMLAERARLVALALGDNQRVRDVARRYGVALLQDLAEWE